VMGLGDLPREVVGRAASITPELLALPEEGCDLDQVLGEAERRLILQALERSGGVRVHAAKILNISLRSLRYRLQKLDIATPEDGDGDGDDEETGAPAPTSAPDESRSRR
jgi:two-component system response regulator PilR (NtrC family)